MYGEQFLTPAEIELVEDFESLDRWNDTSVYKDAKGKKIPELFEAMVSMAEYKAMATARRREIQSGDKQWYDIG